MKKKYSKLKHVFLGIAIALIFTFFVAYAIQTVYPSPTYEDYCGDYYSKPMTAETEEPCLDAGGLWESFEDYEGKKSGYCNIDYYCSQDYLDNLEPYERNVFVINLIVGVIAIAISLLISFEAVSLGVMGGGILLVVYGTIRYWGSLTDWLRTILLGLALVVLIWLGYKKLKY